MKKRVLLVMCFVALAFMPQRSMAEEKIYLMDSLSVGDIVEDFQLPDAFGEMVSLHEELKKGPVVLSFYRGRWCPVCSFQLRGYQKGSGK